MDYVVSDIHGRKDLLDGILKQVNFNKDDHLYILGDVIDRGNDSIALLQWIMKQDNVTMILGNHEEMMLEYVKYRGTGDIDERLCLEHWMNNGGSQTLLDWLKLPKEEQESVVAFLHSLKLMIVKDDYLMVHAGIQTKGIDFDDSLEWVTKQKRDYLLWAREEFYGRRNRSPYTIIFGHTPTKRIFAKRNVPKKKPMEVWIDPIHQDKICIDCGAGSSFQVGGRLALFNLTDQTVSYFSDDDLEDR